MCVCTTNCSASSSQSATNWTWQFTDRKIEHYSSNEVHSTRRSTKHAYACCRNAQTPKCHQTWDQSRKSSHTCLTITLSFIFYCLLARVTETSVLALALPICPIRFISINVVHIALLMPGDSPGADSPAAWQSGLTTPWTPRDRQAASTSRKKGGAGTMFMSLDIGSFHVLDIA
jgi:hypothetical protein